MTEYGQVLNPYYDPAKNRIYEVFTNYFDNPVLTKIKDVEQFSMYMAKIFSLVGNLHRYLVLIVNKDSNQVGFKKNMKNFEWISLQTRSLEDVHNIQVHNFHPNVKIPEVKQKIRVRSRDEKQTVYDCDEFPLMVTLLHTRKNYTMQYPDIGNITTALETYQTIFNFK